MLSFLLAIVAWVCCFIGIQLFTLGHNFQNETWKRRGLRLLFLALNMWIFSFAVNDTQALQAAFAWLFSGIACRFIASMLEIKGVSPRTKDKRRSIYFKSGMVMHASAFTCTMLFLTYTISSWQPVMMQFFVGIACCCQFADLVINKRRKLDVLMHFHDA